MPRKRRPQASRARRPRAKKAKSAEVSLSRRARHNKRAPRPASLSSTQLKIRASVLAAHADMQRDPTLTAVRAADDHGVRVSDFWVYAPKAFKKDSRGRIRAVRDRYVRRMEVPGADGPIVIKVKGSKARSQVARFRNDVFDFLGGNANALDKWKGVKIQGHELLTDPQVIRLLGEQDNLPEHFGSEQVIPYSRGAA